MEKVFGREIDYVLPYEPREVFRAINFGEPFILSRPDIPVSAAIEDIRLSSNDLRDDPVSSKLGPTAPRKERLSINS